MTTKQIIQSAKKQKDINLMILAYERYYQEQREKPDYQRIKEIEAMPERIQKVVLYNILKRKFLGITRATANSIIKHFFKTREHNRYNWSTSRPKFYAKDLIKEFNLTTACVESSVT